MGNVVEFYVKMKDMMSSGLVKLASTAQSSFNAVQSSVDKVTGKNKVLSMSFDEIARKIRQNEQIISSSRVPDQIKAARRELEQLQKQKEKHLGNTTSSKSGGGGMLSSLLPVAGLAGAMALGGSMINNGLQAQARQTSFEVMSGKSEGTRLNKDLTKYAQDSIYGQEVFQNAQTMMGFGISSKDVMANTKMLGDIAMGDANKLGSLTLAFSQVSAAGKLTGQDLLQFINAGFNPLQEMSKKTGLSIGQLKDKMEKGAISFDMVKQAFADATSEGGRFYKMTDKIAQTDFGTMQAFYGAIDGLSTQIGGYLAPMLGMLVKDYIAPFVEWLGVAAEWLKQNSDWVGLVAISLGTLLVVYKGIILATQLWTAVQTALNVVMAMNPYFLAAAGIAALVAGVLYAWNKFEGFRMVVYGLWGAFKQVFTNIGNFFKQIFSPIFEAIDAFKQGKFLEAGKSIAKLAYNLSPVGLAVNSAKFIYGGGLTKGVQDAYKVESLKGKNAKGTAKDKPTEASASAIAMPKTVSELTGTGSGSSDTVKGVTSGGPRVININGVRFADKIEIHAATFEKGMDNVKDVLDEYLLRILNSGSALQS